MEEEFDAMLMVTAIGHGIEGARFMRIGYEQSGFEPETPPVKTEPQRGRHSRMPKTASPVMPSPEGKLTPEEIIRRNNERRRLRGLRENKP